MIMAIFERKTAVQTYMSTLTDVVKSSGMILSSSEYSSYESDLRESREYFKKEVKYFAYYPEQYRTIFNYTMMANKFHNCGDIKKQKDLVSFLGNGLIYYFPSQIQLMHIRTDFKKFKKMSLQYYLNTNLAERLKLRYLFNKEIRQSKEFEKYKFFATNERDKTTFFDLVKKVFTLSTYNYNLQHTLDPIAKSACKLFLFNINEIEKLIREIDMLPESQSKKYRIRYLILLALHYNDALVYDRIEDKTDKEEKYKFLHSKSDHGEMFLKTFLSYCHEYMTKNFSDEIKKEKSEKHAHNHRTYEKKNISDKKKIRTLYKLKEILKLFTLSDNSFSEDINNSAAHIEDYENFKRIYNEYTSGSNKFNSRFASLLENLTNNINILCERYYFLRMPNENDSGTDEHAKFVELLQESFDIFNSKYAALLNSCDIGREAIDNIKVKRHFDRIINKSGLDFVKHDKFLNHIMSKDFIETFKFVPFLRALYVILESVQHMPQMQKEKIIDQVFEYIKIFTLTQTGLEFLISQNAMKKVNQLFHAHPTKYLSLVYNFFKGMNLYKIIIRYKFTLQKVTEDILAYFLKLDFEDLKVKSKAIVIIKILSLISEHLDFNYMKEVKRTIFKHLQERGIFVKAKFAESFKNSDLEKHKLESVKEALTKAPRAEINGRIETEQEDDDEKGLLYKQPRSSMNVGSLDNGKRKSISTMVKYKFLNWFQNLTNVNTNEEMQGDEKSSTYLDQKIYFSYFKLISYNTFFVLKNEQFRECIEELYTFNDLDLFAKVLNTKYLPIDKRTSLLKYIYSIYFLDMIGDAQSNQTLFNSEEYCQINRHQEYLELINKFKDKEEASKTKLEDLMKQEFKKENYELLKYKIIEERYKDELDDFMKDMKTNTDFAKKYNFTENFIKAMDIYIKELDNMYYWIYSSKSDTKDIEHYLSCVMNLIRFVSDYFWDLFKKSSIYYKLIIQYYVLAEKFLQHLEQLKAIKELTEKQPVILNDIKAKVRDLIALNITTNDIFKRFKEQDIFFDLPRIYAFVLEGIRYLDLTMIKENSVEKFYENYDISVAKDYFTIGITFDGEYERFYIDETKKQTEPVVKKLPTAAFVDQYNVEFKQIRDMNIFTVLSNLSADISVRESLAVMLFKYYDSNLYIDEDFEFSLLNIVTKVLFYDTNTCQNVLKNILDEKFFIGYFNKLQTCVATYSVICDKFYLHYNYMGKMNMKAKLMLQFLQLLGEGFYDGFLDFIFLPIEITKEEQKQFFNVELYLKSLNYEKIMEDIKSQSNKDALPTDCMDTEEERPVIFSNQGFSAGNTTGFAALDINIFRKVTVGEDAKQPEEIKVCTEGVPDAKADAEGKEENKDEAKEEAKEEKKEEKKIYICFYENFFRMLNHVNKFFVNLKTIDIETEDHLCDDHLAVLLSNLTNLIIEYNGNFKKEYEEKLTKHECGLSLYGSIEDCINSSKEILFKREILKHKNRRNLILFSKLNYLNLLKSIVQNKEYETVVKSHFNTNINKSRLYEEIIFYIQNEIQNINNKDAFFLKNLLFVNKLDLDNKKVVDALLHHYITNSKFEKSMELKFCIEVFKYINISSNNYSDDEMMSYFNSIEDTNETTFNSVENEYYDSLGGYRVFQFLTKIVSSVTIASESDEGGVNRIYYLKPSFSFLLSEQTKQKFLDNVDRSAATSKLKEMIDAIDYFVFEMVLNYHRFSSNRLLAQLNNIRMYYFELFNYIVVLIHQILLFVHFYKAKNMSNVDKVNLFSEDEKFTTYFGNYVLSIIQVIFLSIIVFLWFVFFAKLNYQAILMKNHDINFVVSTAGEKKSKTYKAIKFTDDFIKDNEILLNQLNDEVTYIDKLKVIVFDLILFNREIIFLLVNIVLLILYLSSQNAICLVIPVILITNLSAFLYDIFYVIQIKWKQLALVIFYTYLLVYLFSWIAFLYIYKIFVTEAMDIEQVNILLTFREQ
jgi:hypothetical protein